MSSESTNPARPAQPATNNSASTPTSTSQSNTSNANANRGNNNRSNRNQNRNNKSANRNNSSSVSSTAQSISNTFKGKETEMNGNVFQLPSERRSKGQFNETLEALQLYTSKHFKKDIDILQPLFDHLSMPEIPKPVHPRAKAESTAKSASGVPIKQEPEDPTSIGRDT